MYASGVPLGLLTDAKGPRITTLLGAVTLAIGYYPIYQGGSDICHGRGYLNGSNLLIAQHTRMAKAPLGLRFCVSLPFLPVLEVVLHFRHLSRQVCRDIY